MLPIFALVCLTLMTGCEFCVAAFLEPTLRRLPESVQAEAVPRFAALLGRVMPFWYALSLLLTLAAAFVEHRATGRWMSGASLAAVVQLLILGVTLGLLVPINNRLARMRQAYDGWLNDARHWDTLHRIRVALLLLACALLAFVP